MKSKTFKIYLLSLFLMGSGYCAAGPQGDSDKAHRESAKILRRIHEEPVRTEAQTRHMKGGGEYDVFFSKTWVQFFAQHGVTYNQAIEHRRKALAASIQALEKPKDPIGLPADKTHWHLVWVTDPDHPHPVPYINTIINNIRRHQRLFNFHIWSNSSLEGLTKELTKENLSFQCHNLEEMAPTFTGPISDLINRCISNKYYAFASDIIRVLLVHHHGTDEEDFNLYTDLGFQFKTQLNPAVLRQFHQLIGIMECRSPSPCFIDMANGFIGGRKGNAATGTFLENLFSKVSKPSGPDFYDETILSRPYPPFFSVPSMMVAFHSTPQEGADKTLYLPIHSTRLVKWEHMSSWAKGTKGQAKLSASPLSPEIFYGERILSYKNDYIPKYPDDMWGNIRTITCKPLRVLEVEPFDGRDTNQLASSIPNTADTTLDIMGWWQPYTKNFPVGGSRLRFRNNTYGIHDMRQGEIIQSHPLKGLENLNQALKLGSRQPYHLIHLRFLHTRPEGYKKTIMNTYHLLQQGGFLLMPFKMWDDGGYGYLKEAATEFLSSHPDLFTIHQKDQYLWLQKN